MTSQSDNLVVSRITDQTQKRTDLLFAAAGEFADKGFGAASIDEIAILAGLGKGTVYLYFKSKKELYLAVLREIVKQFNVVASHVLAMPNSHFEKIQAVADTLFGLDASLLPFLKLWVRHQFQNSPEFAEDVALIFSDLLQPLCEIVSDGVKDSTFDVEEPAIVGYFILSQIVMLIPELQASNGMPTIAKDERSGFLMDNVRRMLGVGKDSRC